MSFVNWAEFESGEWVKPDFEMGFCLWVWTCGSANWGAAGVVDSLTWVYWGLSKTSSRPVQCTGKLLEMKI